MLNIILILFAIGVIISLFQKIWVLIKFIIKAILILGGIALAVYFYYITIPILIIYFIYKILCKFKFNRSIKRWIKEKTPIMSEYQVDDILFSLSSNIKYLDKNKSDYKFGKMNIPYGRINAFLNYFEKSIDTEEIYYYSAVCSSNNSELREYGTAIIRSGIFISKQLNRNSSAKNKTNTNYCKEIIIPFSGLWKTELLNDNITIKYINVKDASVNNVIINQSDTTIPLSEINKLCDNVIKSKINHALCKNGVISNEESLNKANIAEEKFHKKQVVIGAGTIATNLGVIGANELFNTQYSETKNFMNGIRGNGYAAEYANNTLDKLQGKNVINAAQMLDESGRQVKNGADRIVNGQQIQTRYYKTASETIGSAFEHNEAIYIRNDGTGKMMQIEVPRDQYKQACDVMQKRINSGQVPNVEPGEKAANYVRRGYFTYAQSFNICKAGTIESLTVDALNGAICSSVAGGISASIVFATAIWNGHDVEEAAKAGIHTGLKVLGKGTMIYTLTMQLSREQFANPFIREKTKDGIYKGLAGVENPAFAISEKVANSISTSTLAKTSFGKSIGLSSLNGRAVISNSVTAAVVFGPDICRALSGKISTHQLFKNSAVGASSIGACVIGQALIPIPIVGSAVGGIIGGFVAKSVLDKYVEDDAKIMFQILKEEFLDVVMLSNLTKDEFDKVLNLTLCNNQLDKILREMYASNEYRKFAREAIVSTSVINVISLRKYISVEMINEGYEKVFKEVA